MNPITRKTQINGVELSFETGKLAEQATSAVLGRLGETVVLVTIVVGQKSKLDYFPLSVEYVERLYAGGRIKGSRWVKREGRPTDEAVLSGRLIDRSIRPLFPKDFKNDVQVVATVLSVDGENDPSILALLTTSAALAISPIPWNGPVAGIRIGRIAVGNENEGALLVNPTTVEQVGSDLDLVITNRADKTVMIETAAQQVGEEVFIKAVEKSHEETSKLIAFINEFAKEAGKPKMEYEKEAIDETILRMVEQEYKKEIDEVIKRRVAKEAGGDEFAELASAIVEQKQIEAEKKGEVEKAIDYVFKKTVRKNVLEKGARLDGRNIDQIRPLSSSVSILPRTHGSAIFQRGQTQVLSIVTLGSPAMGQIIESAEGEETKRYMHHYSFPPYSVGETGRIGFLNRREIGHGALAEKALIPVIPDQETFPYAIRVVSEVLSSNGSTSMASVCGSTLALMDAGVPIKDKVAGIAMGLVSEEDKYVVLTDIMGIEDFTGDMDFKVAGTKNGITAVQLDVKNSGLTEKMIAEIIERAKTARLLILKTMDATLEATRPQVSQYAPKIEMIKIPVEKIGEVIGPGGKMIRNIMAQTGATVDVEDDGSIAISGTNQESVDKAVNMIQGMTRQVMIGEEFDGEVKRILPFGAFVEILPGKEGMVHVSKMSADFVKDPNEIVSIGKQVHVWVAEIDDMGRINLSMLAPGEEKKGGNGGLREGGSGGEQRPFYDRPRRSYGGDRSGGSRGGRGGYGGNRGGSRNMRSSGSSAGGFPRDRFRKDEY